MTGWAILLLLGAAVLAGVGVAARAGRGALALVAAGLLVAAVGYAWQGNPSLAGAPTRPRANHPAADPAFAAERRIWLDQVGADGQALDAADGLIARGDPGYAVGILRAALVRAPEDMTLWIGLGNALATYADGAVTPAAVYAFGRAAKIAPRHPAPTYFLALAYAQSGDFDAAERLWRALLAGTPDNAPYKPLIAEKLAILERFRAAG